MVVAERRLGTEHEHEMQHHALSSRGVLRDAESVDWGDCVCILAVSRLLYGRFGQALGCATVY